MATIDKRHKRVMFVIIAIFLLIVSVGYVWPLVHLQKEQGLLRKKIAMTIIPPIEKSKKKKNKIQRRAIEEIIYNASLFGLNVQLVEEANNKFIRFVSVSRLSQAIHFLRAISFFSNPLNDFSFIRVDHDQVRLDVRILTNQLISRNTKNFNAPVENARMIGHIKSGNQKFSIIQLPNNQSKLIIKAKQ